LTNGSEVLDRVAIFIKIYYLMKPILYCLIAGLFVLAGLNKVYAQSKTTTYILVRHAEKASATDPSMQSDPELSDAGTQRAQSLVAVLKDHKIDAIYATNFIRTKYTVKPLAEKLSLETQIYDARSLKGFADELKKLEGKTVLVAGHSNTTPMLANLLLVEKKYEPLDESVYNKIFIITVTDGKATSEVIEY
jgi:broad specificity phosphatase PhoE